MREVLAFILTDEPKKSALTPTQSASANNAAEAFVIDTSWDSATSNTQPDPSDDLWEVTFPERYIKKILVFKAFNTPISGQKLVVEVKDSSNNFQACSPSFIGVQGFIAACDLLASTIRVSNNPGIPLSLKKAGRFLSSTSCTPSPFWDS